jgi:hypothetical protein
MTTITRGEALALKAEGLTYSAIAIRYGVSRQYVYQLCEPTTIERARVYSRDDFKCIDCGTSSRLHIHHTMYTGKIEDMVTLCPACHRNRHSGGISFGYEPRNSVVGVRVSRLEKLALEYEAKQRGVSVSSLFYEYVLAGDTEGVLSYETQDHNTQDAQQ